MPTCGISRSNRALPSWRSRTMPEPYDWRLPESLPTKSGTRHLVDLEDGQPGRVGGGHQRAGGQRLLPVRQQGHGLALEDPRQPGLQGVGLGLGRVEYLVALRPELVSGRVELRMAEVI